MSTEQLLSRMADIALPEPTPNLPWGSLSMLIGGFSLITLSLIFIRKKMKVEHPTKTDTEIAISKITTLESNWKNKHINSRQAAFELATLIRLGLGLNQLNHLQTDDQHHLTELSTVRYQRNEKPLEKYHFSWAINILSLHQQATDNA